MVKTLFVRGKSIWAVIRECLWKKIQIEEKNFSTVQVIKIFQLKKHKFLYLQNISIPENFLFEN